MTVKRSSETRPAAKKSATVSKQDLARFVKRLSFLYGDATVGNASLSRALSDLAAEMMQNERVFSSKAQRDAEVRQRNVFSNLSAASVQQLLSDASLTKNDLTTLASERFSIAPAKLQKMTVEGVRETIRTALRNEESLNIISSEASRGASTRSS